MFKSTSFRINQIPKPSI